MVWFLSPCKFSHVLSALDLLTHSDIHYIVLDLCDAGNQLTIGVAFTVRFV